MKLILNMKNNENIKFNEETIKINDFINEDIELNNDGKRNRKAVFRRTIDYNSSMSLMLDQRTLRRLQQRNVIQPDVSFNHLLTLPQDYKDNAMNGVCTKHVRTSTNKTKSPIHSLSWTPDGRRLITASGSGEFTLWNGLTFNFETILQATDAQIKAMKWSHNEQWLLSGDSVGLVKYWQANMNDVNAFQAHKDAIQGLSFCPSDKKFVTCSIDNTVRIWDFQLSKEERVLRGHSGEVKCVEWHPTKAIIISGSRDNQQPLKFWDPKSGECISTLYAHKNSVNDIAINKNGNWFLSASRDQTMKLFDLRNLKIEMKVFRGHEKEINRVIWHPYHEDLFASGGSDGTLKYWMAGNDKEVDSVNDAHDGSIYTMDWHPAGHILATGSHDYTTKFWTRSRPGDINDNHQVDQNGILMNTSQDSVKEDCLTTEQRTNKLELELQNLTSSIEADLNKSDSYPIFFKPELIEKSGEELEINNDIHVEDSQDIDSKVKAANKEISKQFILNWTEKSKYPAGYILSENITNVTVSAMSIPMFPTNLEILPQHMSQICNTVQPIQNNTRQFNDNMSQINNKMQPINVNMMPIHNNMQHINNNIPPNNDMQLTNNNIRPINNVYPLNNNFHQFNNNMQSINYNMSSINNMQMNNNLPLLNDNVHPTNNNMRPMNNNIQPMNNNMHPMNNNLPSLNDNMHPMNNNMRPMNNNIQPMHPLNNNLPPLNNNMRSMDINNHKINNYAQPMNNNFHQVNDNMPQVNCNVLSDSPNINPISNNIRTRSNEFNDRDILKCEELNYEDFHDDLRNQRDFGGPRHRFPLQSFHNQRPQLNTRPIFQQRFQQNNFKGHEQFHERPQFSSQRTFNPNDNQFNHPQLQRRQSPLNNDFNQYSQRQSRQYNQEDSHRLQRPFQMKHNQHPGSQYERDFNRENPFEPQQSTGFSKAFIPLSFKDGTSNKRLRRGSNW